MKHLFYSCIFLYALISCTPRVIEDPFITMATTQMIDIARIERTDSATIIDLEFFGHPQYAVQITPKIHLETDGESYNLLSVENLKIGDWIRFDKQGYAKARLHFEPIPKKAKSIDYINEEKQQYIWGIGLTKKESFAEYPELLPEELRLKCDDCEIPEPIFEVGKSKITIHLLGYREQMGNEIELKIYDLMEGSAGSRSFHAKIDAESHTATMDIYLEGSTFTALCLNDLWAYQWLAPKEDTDIYIDLRASGSKIMSQRGKAYNYRKLYEFWRSQIPTTYTTGTYSQLNYLFNSIKQQPIRLNPQTNGYYGDYRLTCEQYTDYTQKAYKKLLDSIDHHPTMTPFEKHISRIYTDLDLVYVAAGYPFIKSMSESRLTGAFRHPKSYKDCSDEQLQEMVKPFNWDNRSYCLFTQEVANFMGVTNNLPNRLQLTEDNFYKNIREATRIKFNIEHNNSLSTEDEAALSKMPTFFQEVCQAKVEEVQELLAIKNGQIAPTPKTEAERLFDAIIAPYKGKVVVVDFWNTWCNPCLAAHKEIEPLKSGELKSDDIVWIYIADDSSPEATYKEKIQHIKGKHYRFSSEQAKIVKRQFGIKAIPSYVLVEKSGEYKLRDDVRNINRLKSELKKRIDL